MYIILFHNFKYKSHSKHVDCGYIKYCISNTFATRETV